MNKYKNCSYNQYLNYLTFEKLCNKVRELAQIAFSEALSLCIARRERERAREREREREIERVCVCVCDGACRSRLQLFW